MKLTTEHKGKRRRYEYTMSEIRQEILHVMKTHIGLDKGITKQNLIKKALDIDTESLPFLQRMSVNNTVSNAMSQIRLKSDCFIARQSHQKKGAVYFVLQTQKELNALLKQKDSVIAGQRYIQQRARKAVKERWYKRQWQVV